MSEFARTIEELTKHAVSFWPTYILELESDTSVLPILLLTQEKFISILNLADSAPASWKKLLKSSKMESNLFLKHLMVLSDLGGETLNKYPPLNNFFNKGKMKFLWQGNTREYQFKSIQKKTSLTNNSLHVDGKRLLIGSGLNKKMEDVIMLLLYGSACTNDTLPDDFKSKCSIGEYIGQPDLLKDFVKQSYIRVSRQIGGATANALGQITQTYAMKFLQNKHPDWVFTRNGSLPSVSHTGGGKDSTFDVVAVSPSKKYFGIEVSFQVTTNSTIERKAGQAKARASMVHDAGHKICYIIDGAGNINVRKSATATICKYSDCTVTFAESDLEVLSRFLKINGS